MNDAASEVAFAEWRHLTLDRMAKADVAAALLTCFPLLPVVLSIALLAIPGGEGFAGYIGFVATAVCMFGSLMVALLSIRAGGKADALAKELGLEKGVDWLAGRRKHKK